MKLTAAAQAERDRVHMARCLELAAHHRGRTSPNPIVGCVIVDRGGKVIAEGAHVGPGKDHGERAALRKLKDKAKGATLYVNLEPCNHHGRTPPCAPLVRDSGVARVVVGCEDPIREHAGGIALLRRGKVKVTSGVLREACERANLPFFTWARERRPAFTLKAAITPDGKIATVGGESKWITGPEAREDVMRLRNGHDAVLVGIGTVLADDPKLTARLRGARDPVRIVLDRSLRTPTTAAVLAKGARTIVVTADNAPADREAALVARGAEVWRGLDLTALGRRLAAEGLTSVLVEGGGQVQAAFLAAGLADQVVLYIAPKAVGGAAPSWVGGAGVAAMADAYGLQFDEETAFIGGDLRVSLSVPRRDSV